MVRTIRIESYTLFGCYLILAIVCWFVFWHHPSHIGIKIRKSYENSNSFGFVVDNTTTFWNPKSTQVSTVGRRNLNSTLVPTATQSMVHNATHQSRFGVEDDIPPENRSLDTDLVKMDVTLIDAFKIKEINLLIASYVFAMSHNLYILKSS